MTSVVAEALVNRIRSLYPEYTNETGKNHTSIQKSNVSSSSSEKSTIQVSLDTQSILKATQVIAQEIKLESLLKKLMMITIENAAAQRGILLLFEDDVLYIEAEGSNESKDVKLFSKLPIKNYFEIPQSLIQYSLRTSSSIILDSALEDSQFGDNPYIQSERILSLLCNPIFSKGKIIGLLYLENNLIKGAFTKDRVDILNMIVSQAAISIENAKLYYTLEEKVLLRTNELEIQKSEVINQSKRLQKIQSFTKTIQNVPDFESMIEKISLTFKENFGLSVYLFYICNFKSNNLELLRIESEIPLSEDIINNLKNNTIPFTEENSFSCSCTKVQ
jgi:transcriptional regulator with GAF, ATPase, and Fis domain